MEEYVVILNTIEFNSLYKLTFKKQIKGKSQKSELSKND